MSTVTENQGLQLRLQLAEARIRRQQAEIRRLEADRALHANLFNAIGAVVFILDSQHRFLDINRAAARLLGTTAESLRGHACHTVMHCRDTPPEGCPLTAVLETGRYATGTMYVESIDRHMWVSCTPVFDDSGELKKVIHIADDITEQVRMREQLAASEKRLRTILDALPDMIIETDTDHNTIWANRAALAVNPHAVGKPCFTVFGPTGGNAPCDDCVLQEALHAGEMVSRINRRPATNDHPRGVWWHNVGIPLKDTSGRVTRLIEFSRNITRDMIARRDLEASERQFRLLAENSDDTIWTMDADARLIYINPAVERLLGYTPDELIGQPLSSVLLPDAYAKAMAELKRFRSRLDAGQRDESPVRLEMAHRSRDGQSVITEVVVNKVFDREGAFCYFIGVSRDITERQRREEALRRAYKLEAVGVLAGGLAHDFNNLLSVILGNLEMMAEGGGAPPAARSTPHGDPYLTSAREATLRARDLTHQLLAFAKGGDPVKQPSSLMSIITRAISHHVPDSRMQTRIDVAPEVETIIVDPLQIETAIGNILRNAVEAMPDGGEITITAASHHLSGIDEDALLSGNGSRFLKLSIADQGPGIPASVYPQIFDPYFTTKPLGAKKGRGLGLTLSHAIVRKHGGWIDADTTVGRGSCFTLLMPIGFAPSAPSRKRRTAAPTKRILLMDDEAQLRLLTAQMLEHLGYEVETVADGAAAITAYERAMNAGHAYGLVILDLTVKSGMGGKDALRELRRLDPTVAAVVSSGFNEDPVMTDPQRYGFAAVLPKPYALKELTGLLERLLPRAAPAPQSYRHASEV